MGEEDIDNSSRTQIDNIEHTQKVLLVLSINNQCMSDALITKINWFL